MSAESTPPRISVVVPVHDESGNVAPLCEEIGAVLAAMGDSFEVIYVNDGSTDGTLGELRALLGAHPFLRVIDLDGNFGEAAALSAGFAAARGAIVATLDGDGQNDPRDLPRLLEALDTNGRRAVSGRRRERKENTLLRVLPSRLANRAIASVTGVPLHDHGCGLKVYRREALRGIALPGGMHRFLPAILGVSAAEVAEVDVVDRARIEGRSHYGIGRVLLVLRDLPALPFLRRRYAHADRALAASAFAAASLGLAGAKNPLLLGGGALVAALCASAWWNLRRFETAREKGVYRVRGEFGTARPGHAEGSR